MRTERVDTDAVRFVTCSVARNPLPTDADARRNAEKRVRTLCKLCGTNDAIGTKQAVSRAAEQAPWHGLREGGFHRLSNKYNGAGSNGTEDDLLAVFFALARHTLQTERFFDGAHPCKVRSIRKQENFATFYP